DEGLALERVDVAALRLEPPGLAERRAEILHDVPAPGPFARPAFHVIELVVLGFEIGAVHDHHQHEQAIERPFADEGIAMPVPHPDLLQADLVRPESCAPELLPAAVIDADPALDEPRWHLVVAERPDEARRDHFGLRLRA